MYFLIILGEWDFDDVIYSNQLKSCIGIDSKDPGLSSKIDLNQSNNSIFGFSQQSINNSKNPLNIGDQIFTNAVNNANQKSKYSSLKETSYITQDLPDDTKNSIVQLLNEIWK